MAASDKTLLGGLAGVASACLVGGFLACATGSSSPPTTTVPGILGEVIVERDGEATLINLVGVVDPVFTAFLGQDPLRIVVDLASVRPGSTGEALTVYDGLVEEVSIAEFAGTAADSSTRVEVTLSEEPDYEVTPQPDGLQIRVTPALGVVSEIDSEAAESWDESETPWDAEDSGNAAEPEPQTPATRLLGVWSERADEEGSVIRLRTDGFPMELESFTLDDPPRLVIDLPNLQHEVTQGRVELGTQHAARVRIGQHADKVRVVVDGGGTSAPFEQRQILPVSDGLLVALGSGEAVTTVLAEAGSVEPAAMPQVVEEDEEASSSLQLFADGESEIEVDTELELAAAESPEPGSFDDPESQSEAVWEPDEETDFEPEDEALEPAVDGTLSATVSAVRIYGVQYDAQEVRDRIAILSEHPVEYQLMRPDGETLVVAVPGATLDPEAAIRVAPEGGGPVSLVSAFQQPDMARPEVRVVVKRAPGLLPTVTQHGTMLFLDFVRGGAVAEIPPVFSTQADETAQPAAELPPTPTAQASAEPAPHPAVGKAMASAAASIALDSIPVAALEPEQAIEVLAEGGLLDGKEYVGRRISLDFKDVDVQDVLRLIADVSDLNLIAGDEVTGKVTIRLVDVPWDQALDVILLTKGLGFVHVGNVLRIAPAEILKDEEEVRLQERRAMERLEDLVVKLQPVNYADVKEIANMVKRLLTPRGSVDVDTRTSTVIIKDIASVIDEATALIKAIDTQTPQVLIEAKVVEANLDFSRELGSEWAFGSSPFEDEIDFNVGGIETVTSPDTDFPYNDANNIVVRNPIASTATGLLNIGAFILDDRFNVDVRIAAAETEGEGKVISSPRVVTLDNREAIIQQGVSIPFQTFENGDAQLEFIDAVLMLKVTPHITADRSIIMKIEVTRNAPDDSVPTPTGSPAIAKNQAQTETLVKDGQTLVLGGIYVIQKGQSQSRVPFMHTIPVFGNLFQNKNIRDIRKELLIFVTPRVVIGPELPS
jgi:type IV pilus assembly protein PilQ